MAVTNSEKCTPELDHSPMFQGSPTLTLGTTFSSNYDEEAGKFKSSRRASWWEPGKRDSKSDKSEKKLSQVEERERREFAARGINITETRQLEKCPVGHPRMAAFLSSESSFSLYRSFSYLHSRSLLGLQAELSDLETELDELDLVDDDDQDGRKRLKDYALDKHRSRDDPFRPRHEILTDIRTKLVEYDELLIKARDIQAFQKPSARDYKSVRTWFWNVKPVVAADSDFIRKKEDVITLRSGREWSSFDGIVEGTLKRFDCELLRRIFCTPELREKTSDEHVYYYSTSRVEAFVGLIITAIVFVLLVLPVVAMYMLTSFGTPTTDGNGTFKAIGVLVVFTLLFSAAMSMLTRARRHELFAASAAYCAVLVVFISNFSGPAG